MPASANLLRTATACCFSSQALSRRCAALRSRPAPAARTHRQAVRAAQPGERKGGGAGAGGRLRPWRREAVTFLVPDHAKPGRTDVYPFVHVTQRTLNNILDKTGTLGFRTASVYLSNPPSGA